MRTTRKMARQTQLQLPRGHMSVELEGALRRLRNTVKQMPDSVKDERQRRWKELQRHLGVG